MIMFNVITQVAVNAVTERVFYGSDNGAWIPGNYGLSNEASSAGLQLEADIEYFMFSLCTRESEKQSQVIRN